MQRIVDFAVSKIGCGYIYGATGFICTPTRRQQQAEQYPEYASKILGKEGAQWDGKQCYDCSQLTKASCAAAGVSIPSGATSQWRDKAKWAERGGTIDGMPDVPGILLYKGDGTTMTHTGVYVGDSWVVEAKGHADGVVKTRLSASKWTHWAKPKITGQGVVDVPEDVIYQAKVVTQTDPLTLRAQPGTSGTKLASIPRGATVDVLARDVIDGWDMVRYGGKTGYVNASYLERIASPTPPITITVKYDMQAVLSAVEDVKAAVDALEQAVSGVSVEV